MKELDFDVAVIGAGFAGMYLLHRLRGLGMHTRVFEAGSDVGGTWYWNRYPGARCDIESMQYSYQFDEALQQDWTWSERYAAQPEILTYAQHVAQRFDLRRDIRFDCRIASARFEEPSSTWTLADETGQETRARICIFATGCLSVPNWPSIEGMDDFSGPTYHTALWPHERIDFTGRRVAIIGTGSSAIQSIPLIAREAEQLYVFQRTANYAIPAHNGPLAPDKAKAIKASYAEVRARAKQNFAGIDATLNARSALADTPEQRQREYERRWQEGGLTFSYVYDDLLMSKEANDTAASFVRDKIRAVVKDPRVAEVLCPDNIIGGKRLCVDSDYFATFNRNNVTLIDLRKGPIEKISDRAIAAQGQDFEIDDLVIATGFDAMTGALTSVDIRGRREASLRERWANGPSSYLGLAMSDFPNLFTVTGPGSPSVFTNMLPTIEQSVDWIADCLAHMQAHNYNRIEAEREAETLWWNHVQEVAAKGLKATTDSWYLGANVEGKARVFLPYFGGFPAYCRTCDEVVAQGYRGFAFL